MIKTGKLCNVFRFTDDLNAINDAGIFESNSRDIFPEELELCIENGNNVEATFLELYIKIKSNKYETDLLDERNSFPFSIVRMPEKSSNIFSNTFYMSRGAECLRIAGACNNQNSFLNSINPLVRRMISQGAKNVE